MPTQYFWKVINGVARIVDASGNPVSSAIETQVLSDAGWDFSKITQYGTATSTVLPQTTTPAQTGPKPGQITATVDGKQVYQWPTIGGFTDAQNQQLAILMEGGMSVEDAKAKVLNGGVATTVTPAQTTTPTQTTKPTNPTEGTTWKDPETGEWFKYIASEGGWVDLGTSETGEPPKIIAGPSEIAGAQAEAEKYYGYTIPKEMAPYQYPQQEQEIQSEIDKYTARALENYQNSLSGISLEKRQLLDQYNNLKADIETGKIRAGSDQQRDLEKKLEDKRIYLENQEITNKNALDNLQRNWISKGGLFAGPRYESAGELGTQQSLANQSYMSGFEYQTGAQKTAYERALEDYATNLQRGGQTYQTGLQGTALEETQALQTKTRSTEDIALQKIRDIRQLQETYQQAIASRMGQTLKTQYGVGSLTY